ncbi:MAG: hypothetical protein ACP5NW_06110 [Candidatus Woesearchaeota archaeon]
MGSNLKLGIYCSVNGAGPGWYFMHNKGQWFFFPDKNCGVKRAVTEPLGLDDASIKTWTEFHAEDKHVTNILAIINLTTHQILFDKTKQKMLGMGVF